MMMNNSKYVLNLFFLISFVGFSINVQAQLNGTYTLCNSGCTFNSFQHASDSLNLVGLTGPVTIEVQPGVYDEGGIDIYRAGEGLGAFEVDAAKPIVFKGMGDSTQVVVKNTLSVCGTSYYVIKFFSNPGGTGVEYVTFENMTIESSCANLGGKVFVLQKNCHNNTIKRCYFKNTLVTSSITQADAHITTNYIGPGGAIMNTLIENNYFENGSYGINFTGRSAIAHANGFFVKNNTFNNQYAGGIYLQYVDSSMIANNVFTTTGNSNNYVAIQLDDAANKMAISKNSITGIDKINNKGIRLNNVLSSSINKAIIANNFIQAGGTNSQGISMNASSWVYIYHNNINITGKSDSTKALLVTGSSDNFVKNNIFMTDSGYAVHYTTSITDTFDYNNLYSGGNKLAHWLGNDAADILEWRTKSGQGANSLSVATDFVSAIDLHFSNTDLSLNAKGTPLIEVMDDIDGEARDITTPDIGADEIFVPENGSGIISIDSLELVNCTNTIYNCYVQLQNLGADTLDNVTIEWSVNNIIQPSFNWTGNLLPTEIEVVLIGSYIVFPGVEYSIKVWTSNPNGIPDPIVENDTSELTGFGIPLFGTFTIGGALPDFISFNKAIYALINYGICDNVVFKVRNGNYNEQLIIPNIPGTSSASQIVFESESGDSNLVEISYTPTHTDSNYTILLNAAQYVTISKMTITSESNVNNGSVILMEDGTYNYIKNNIVYYGGSRDITNINAINCDSFVDIRNNNIYGGNIAIGVQGYFVGYQTHTIIDGNSMKDSKYGIYVTNQEVPRIDNNILTFQNAYTGIHLNRILGPGLINNNKLYGLFSDAAINIEQSQGDSINHFLITNNFISGDSINKGISLKGTSPSNTKFFDIYFNTINSAKNNGYAMYLGNYVKGINMNNNIFSNLKGKGGMYIADITSIDGSDYNNFYTSNDTAIYLTSAITLADWQTQTSYDLNSLNVNPIFFIDTSDLHLCGISNMLANAGIPITGIIADIDGDIRSLINPSIGADEVQILSPILKGLNDTSICVDNSGLGTQITLGVENNYLYYSWSNGGSGSTTIIDTPGEYRVGVMGNNFACAFDTFNVTFDSCDNYINTLEMVNYGFVYPNPSNGSIFYYRSSEHSKNNYYLLIYNTLGEIVYIQNVLENDNRLNLNQNEGIFTLVVKDFDNHIIDIEKVVILK